MTSSVTLRIGGNETPLTVFGFGFEDFRNGKASSFTFDSQSKELKTCRFLQGFLAGISVLALAIGSHLGTY